MLFRLQLLCCQLLCDDYDSISSRYVMDGMHLIVQLIFNRGPPQPRLSSSFSYADLSFLSGFLDASEPPEEPTASVRVSGVGYKDDDKTQEVHTWELQSVCIAVASSVWSPHTLREKIFFIPSPALHLAPTLFRRHVLLQNTTSKYTE